MKKLLIALLVLAVVLGMSACKKKEEKVEETKESEAVGGWSKVDDGTITDELQKIFDTAVNGLTGATYKAEKLLETQLVSGTNYKFLEEKTTVTAEPVTSKVIVTVYEDLQGNVKLLDITDYTE